MGKKLDIELFKYRNLLFGRIKHVEESLLEKPAILAEEGKFNIRTGESPSLNKETLYAGDRCLAWCRPTLAYVYPHPEKAAEAAEIFRRLIAEVNGEDIPEYIPVERII